uniref:Putative ATP-dependent clp protease clpb family protein n=1 Tax=Linum usitatissimum TaxID=4006 RepID=A0A172MLB4_LINUS|nr:putative ATP-dependent clp protease clpb family protein [Linum usitatissimum]
MPSPVTTARQCLTEEAARALDDAVAVARRRSHSQTTSLHAVSALLALPSSSLRDACFRSRISSSDYPPPRLQFRALELCVGVSLDRLPSSKSADEPLISNALMAAIKRSQANQRRHPDSFHLQQIHFGNQAPAVIKVELKHFIGSILDDPVVSRVFGEAGFISYQIKSVILSPPLLLQTPRFPRSGLLPPSFFSRNLGASDPGFGFGFSFSDDGAENSRRIGEVMVKPEGKGKNPLLLGACASDALKRFVERVKNNSKGNSSGGGGSSLPSEIAGISVVVIESDEEETGQKFDKMGRALEACSGRGIVASFGDLEVLIGGDDDDTAGSYMVSKLTTLLEMFKEKLWLIGAAASYDVYSKFLKRFPAVEKDWDLQLLPITSSSSPVSGFGSKSSLLGSFVPFGGFFPTTTSDLPSPLSSSSMSEPLGRCHLCTAKYEQEVAALLKTANQRSDNLPWLTMAEQNKGKGVDDASKIEDDGSIVALKKKWNDICQRLHRSQTFSKLDTSPSPKYQALVAEDSSTSIGVFNGIQNLFGAKRQMAVVSESKNLEVVEEEEGGGRGSTMQVQAAPCSSSSVSSVTTDLGLGTLYSTKFLEHKEQCDHLSSTNSTTEPDAASDVVSRQIVKASPPSRVPLDLADYKRLRTLLSSKVSWQDSAISAICQSLSKAKFGSKSRNDIWLTFLGPDKIGKKKIASALAEIVSGSDENVIFVDLSYQHGAGSSNSVYQYREFYDDVNFRGKTVIDYIAAEMKKKPRSVIFLENVEQADLLTRASLSQAVSKGKFADSHGREISTSNVIFITTTSAMVGDTDLSHENKTVKYTEESILGAKRWQMQMQVEPVSQSLGITISNVIKVKGQGKTSPGSSMNKRRKLQESNESKKRGFLDLNLPVEETEEEDSDSGEWMQDFFEQVDEKIELKPFDFDALGEKIVKAISFQIQKVFGGAGKVMVEIENDAMVQMIAASWSSEKEEATAKWVENVLGRGFSELRYKYSISNANNVPCAIKLQSCVGILAEELAPGICLPSRITL